MTEKERITEINQELESLTKERRELFKAHNRSMNLPYHDKASTTRKRHMNELKDLHESLISEFEILKSGG